MADIVWGAWIDWDASCGLELPHGVNADEPCGQRRRNGGESTSPEYIAINWCWEECDEATIVQFCLRHDHPIYANAGAPKPEAAESTTFATALLSAIPDGVLIAEVVRRMKES